jgi:YidC/Oxa1 family membrane protein insertase
MPVIFLAVMNRYSAGLSWYYFLANILSFLQNWIFKKIINTDKIRLQIEENLKKPVKKSSFQKKLEEMARQRQQQMKSRK